MAWRIPEEGAAAATPYLRLFALVALAYVWARMAKVALARQGGEETEFYERKLATARFFMAQLLPENSSLFATIMAGGSTLMALEDDAF